MDGQGASVLADIAREILTPVLKEVVADHLRAIPPKKTILTQAELADELRVSVPTLRKEIEAGLPWIPVGDHKRFELDQVLEWLRARRVAA